MSKFNSKKIYKIKKNIKLFNNTKKDNRVKIKNHEDRIKLPNYNRIVGIRYNLFIILTILVFVFLCFNLYNLMINDKIKYVSILEKYNSKETSSDSVPRGRIYDRNYNLLVDNKLVRKLTFKNINDLGFNELIEEIKILSNYVFIDFSKVSSRALREYYCEKYYSYCSSLVTENEYKLYKSEKLTSNEFNNIKINRISDDKINELSDDDRRLAEVYYLMRKGYSYDSKTIKDDLTDVEYASVIEHIDELPGFDVENGWERVYPYGDTFKSILGSVSSIPGEMKNEYLKQGYSLNDRVGISYLEKEYEQYLRGSKDVFKLDSFDDLDLVKEGSRGEDIVLTIDINLQKKLDDIVTREVIATKGEPNTEYYDHSTVILQNPSNGEILAMSSKKYKNGNVVDNLTSVVNETVTPGSIVKGASILVGYNSGSIRIGEVLVDECVKVAATPEKCSYVTLGPIDDITALAKSSNVYQFKTAIRVNGQEYYPNMKMNFKQSSFDKYRDMYHSFGLGVKTEIDLPFESLGYTSKDIRAGNLLDFVIGQYETYTPIQISQYISTIANNGSRVVPHLLKEVRKVSNSDDLGEIDFTYETKVLNKVDTSDVYLNRVRDGFYAVMHMPGGYGVGYMPDYLDGAGKTGTSQSFIDLDNDGVIDTETITSSFVGYAPGYSPKFSIAVISPNSSKPSETTTYASLVTYRITQQVSQLYYDMYGF